MAETPGTPAGPDPDNQTFRPTEGAAEPQAPGPAAMPPEPADSSPPPSATPASPPPSATPASPAPLPADPPIPAESPAPAPGPSGTAGPQEKASAEQPAGIAATVHVPPAGDEAAEPAADGDEGGEWHLLVGKVRDWIENAQLRKQWERLRGPLRGLALLIGLILLLRLYGSVVATIDAIPLIGGLLELVGLITVVRFSTTRLVRAEERDRVFSEWGRAWKQFRGRL